MEWLFIEDKKSGNEIARNISYKPDMFGYYKTKYWKFRKESRFLIYTVLFSKTKVELNALLINNRKLEHEYVDYLFLMNS